MFFKNFCVLNGSCFQVKQLIDSLFFLFSGRRMDSFIIFMLLVFHWHFLCSPSALFLSPCFYSFQFFCYLTETVVDALSSLKNLLRASAAAKKNDEDEGERERKYFTNVKVHIFCSALQNVLLNLFIFLQQMLRFRRKSL